jgi:hypothetical protein
MKVGVNPPRTPVTKGSSGIAAATIPNVCKMPGPPAPFVPTPLPNIGKSGDNLADCTKKVKFEGKEVAIKGASFKSMGDMPSKGTGGGLVSATTHGSTKFVAPGSMDVKAEGKNIQLLGDATTNDNSNPPNSGTVALAQATSVPEIQDALVQIAQECEDEIGQPHSAKDYQKECNKYGSEKHKCCDKKIKDAKKEDVFSDPAYKQGSPGTLIQKVNGMPRERGSYVRQAIGLAKHLGLGTFSLIKGFTRGKMFPDVVVSGGGPPTPGNVTAVYDFKFPCPPNKPPKWGQNGAQGRNLQALTNSANVPKMISPMGVFR